MTDQRALMIELLHSVCWMLYQIQYPRRNEALQRSPISFHPDVLSGQSLTKWLTHSDHDEQFHLLTDQNLIALAETGHSYDMELYRLTFEVPTLRQHLETQSSFRPESLAEAMTVFLKSARNFGQNMSSPQERHIVRALSLPIHRNEFQTAEHFADVLACLAKQGLAFKVNKGIYKWDDSITPYMTAAGLWSDNEIFDEDWEVAQLSKLYNTMPSKLRRIMRASGPNAFLLVKIMVTHWNGTSWRDDIAPDQRADKMSIQGGVTPTAIKICDLIREGQIEL